MVRESRYTARIAFRLPQSLHDALEEWARQEDRPLANLVYTIVRQAASERARDQRAADGSGERAR
jgi:hypothetical protein